jgi:hypothetical protein
MPERGKAPKDKKNSAREADRTRKKKWRDKKIKSMPTRSGDINPPTGDLKECITSEKFVESQLNSTPLLQP